MFSPSLMQAIRLFFCKNKHLLGSLFLGMVAGIAIGYGLFKSPDAVTKRPSSKTESTEESVPKALKNEDKLSHKKTESPTPKDTLKHITYLIKKGDTLSSIFEASNIGQKVMFNLLEADTEALALDTLQPGNKIEFWFDKQNQLQKMQVFLSVGQQAVFTRDKTGYFHYQAITIPGVWKNRVVHGVITNSFYMSALDAGLSPQSIGEIEALLKDKINFSKNIRPGDRFSVLLKEQYVNNTFTGERDVTGVELMSGHHHYTAFLADNGNYYDEKGQSLNRAFSRYPTRRHYRVSSSFNPRRKNPVTGRIAPHNGVDLATPMHTPVLATADGVVTLINQHNPFAGKYIVIRNSSKYYTRFLHLSKILVRKGQRVSRGQRIALSGNTGRSTGPHLHYELHVYNKAVNPMTAKIPLANPINRKERPEFLRTVQWRLAAMDAKTNPVVVSRQTISPVNTDNTKG